MEALIDVLVGKGLVTQEEVLKRIETGNNERSRMCGFYVTRGGSPPSSEPKNWSRPWGVVPIPALARAGCAGSDGYARRTSPPPNTIPHPDENR